MSTPDRKKNPCVLAAVFIFLCLGGVVTLIANRKSLQLTSRMDALFITTTPVCTFGNFVSSELPDVAAEWKSYFESAGIEPADVAASGTGESIECTVETFTGRVYTSSGSVPHPIDRIVVSATIRVPDATDDAALGALVLQISSGKESPPFVLDVTKIVRLKFLAPNGTKEINFDPVSVIDLNARGLTPAQLFAALDGRYAPSATPTP